MPNAAFFARCGLFVEERFFDPESCRQMCAELRPAPTRPSTVDRKGESLIDETDLKAGQAQVPTGTYGRVARALASLRPRMADHFALSLDHCEPPVFTVYRPGDFASPHTDIASSPKSPDHLRNRKVAAVLFLNGESEEHGPDSYGCGTLTFYGLIDDPAWRSMGFPLSGRAGLLIAFPAAMVHAVTPVTHGERYTVVTRYA
jgi:SM-20-related protein